MSRLETSLVAPGNSMKAVTIESPMISERRRPRATGARRISPHDRYHGWSTGPSTTKSSRVAPERFQRADPVAVKSIQTPITRRREAEEPGGGEHAREAHPDVGEVGDPREDERAETVVGAVHERTAPGVPRIVTHPHPSPLT